jgi:uncharacterized glyoxalase superfamily protein PhnB
MKQHNFYEVKDPSGSVWGGESAREAVDFFRRTLNAQLVVSVWTGEAEELYQVIEPVDITPIILHTIVSMTERQ